MSRLKRCLPGVAGGPAWPLSTDKAIPASVCGPDGSAPESCLRTLAGGTFFGNTDTQRMGIGTTLFLTCEVAGCGCVSTVVTQPTPISSSTMLASDILYHTPISL